MDEIRSILESDLAVENVVNKLLESPSTELLNEIHDLAEISFIDFDGKVLKVSSFSEEDTRKDGEKVIAFLESKNIEIVKRYLRENENLWTYKLVLRQMYK